MNLYGPKCFCKKHERFHLVEEPCPYCAEPAHPEDPSTKAKQEEMERMLQWWVLT